MYRRTSHIHFVGIGGIGMSGIATILRYQGYTISGCDHDVHQQSVLDLQKIGCTVHAGNNTPACQQAKCDVLVYSSAIAPDNPEIAAAQLRGIPTIPRALMLAELMRTKYSIAIAGAHGKTTTTSLVSHILIEAGYDPTVVIGGILKNISTHARLGQGDFLVAEADESDRSFLHLYATFAIVTNIDLEHLETYRDLDDIKETFLRFLNNLPFYGTAIVCIDDENVRSLLPINHIKLIKYGLTPEADWWASDIVFERTYSTAILHYKNQEVGSIKLAMPGRHNLLNALAATALAQDLEIPFETIKQALASFKGIERRFSFKGTYKGASIFDDYGHHPTEIQNTLAVAHRYKQHKLTVVFQPHRYIRTHKLWQQFVDTFANCHADRLIITDIYPAGEKPIEGVSGENLAYAIKQKNPLLTVEYLPCDNQLSAISTYLSPLIEQNELILTLGAGKMNKLADALQGL